MASVTDAVLKLRKKRWTTSYVVLQGTDLTNGTNDVPPTHIEIFRPAGSTEATATHVWKGDVCWASANGKHAYVAMIQQKQINAANPERDTTDNVTITVDAVPLANPKPADIYDD